jgi:putative transposase
VSLEEHKRRERAAAIGLFRYRLICPALDDGLSSKQRGKLVREIAARIHTDPFGNQTRISRETLDRWIRRYRAGGFEALVPAPRRLATRTDVQVLELAASLKRENPTRTVAQVARILRTATGWAPSESTLLRHFHRLDLVGPAAGQAPAVFGRFEAADPNELWVGDALCRTRHKASTTTWTPDPRSRSCWSANPPCGSDCASACSPRSINASPSATTSAG